MEKILNCSRRKSTSGRQKWTQSSHEENVAPPVKVGVDLSTSKDDAARVDNGKKTANRYRVPKTSSDGQKSANSRAAVDQDRSKIAQADASKVGISEDVGKSSKVAAIDHDRSKNIGGIKTPATNPQVQQRKTNTNPMTRGHTGTQITSEFQPMYDEVNFIRFQDDETIIQPSGNKCMICWIDLTFAAAGDDPRGFNPPPVAILSCHHHFHAFCLEQITPQSEAHDPPCIQCADINNRTH